MMLSYRVLLCKCELYCEQYEWADTINWRLLGEIWIIPDTPSGMTDAVISVGD